MAHNTLGLPPQILHRLLFQIPLGGLHIPKTIVYAKLGGGGGGGGANKVHYGQLENRELFYYHMKKRLLVCSGNLFISMKEGSC